MKPVAIYTTPTCTYCRMAKEFFKEHDVPYSEYNVASDVVKRGEMIEKTGQMGVPVITIGNAVIVGFNKAKVSELLGITS